MVLDKLTKNELRCKHCSGKAIYFSESVGLCSSHFINRFEIRVKETILKYGLIPKQSVVGVAASGGKDSTVVLYVLKKLGYPVIAVVVDEKIPGYRDGTIHFLKKYCKSANIKLRKTSFPWSYTLKDAARIVGVHPCRICGIFRRSKLNDAAKGLDILATGHNMDDELQSLVLNIVLGNPEQNTRLGPKSGAYKIKGIPQRIKPLHDISEHEIMAYAFLNNLNSEFVECPYARDSTRAKVRDALNYLENEEPGYKKRLFKNLVTIFNSSLKEEENTHKPYCGTCGNPSSGKICNACRILKIIKSKAVSHEQ